MKAKDTSGTRKGIQTIKNLSDSGKNAGETTMNKSHCKEVLSLQGEKASPIEILRDEYEHFDKLHKHLCDAAVKDGAFVIVDGGS